MKSFVGLVLMGLLAMNGQLQAESSITVATSIKPVSMVVKAIGGDKVKIRQIVSNSASPHDFALRPSDLKKILKADLVVWVGESLEPFLEKPIANSQHANTAIEWMTLVEGDEHKKDQGDELHNKGQHEGHHHDGLDPHVWLDMDNALLLAQAVEQALIALAPENALYFQQNRATFDQTLALLDKKNSQQLAVLSELNYVVFHDAYGYFEDHYGLVHLANISLSPERKPGAKKVVAIRGLMQANQVACIFSEVQFNPDIVDSLVEGTDVKVVELDPLGSGIELNEAAYPAFMRKMSHDFLACQNNAI